MVTSRSEHALYGVAASYRSRRHCTCWNLFHGPVGGKINMSNIKSSDLMSLTQSLSLVAWQMFTIFLMVSGATLICVAMKPSLSLLAYPILIGNGLGAVLFLLLGLMGHAALLKMPGMYLMSLTALLGWRGLT